MQLLSAAALAHGWITVTVKVFCGEGKKRGGYTMTAHYIVAHGTCQAPKGKKMLTESEKRWLTGRAKKWANFCDVCTVGNENCKLMYFRKKCPTNIQAKDLLEALEFESRLAAKLADAYWPPLVYTPVAPFEQIFMPPMDRLKWARLAVEEEMDNEP